MISLLIKLSFKILETILFFTSKCFMHVTTFANLTLDALGYMYVFLLSHFQSKSTPMIPFYCYIKWNKKCMFWYFCLHAPVEIYFMFKLTLINDSSKIFRIHVAHRPAVCLYVCPCISLFVFLIFDLTFIIIRQN